MPLYLEDLTIGRTFSAGPVTISEQDVIAFGRAFDPQPFHTDPQLAPSTFFGGLVASGWHTAALCMRMLVDSEIGTIANGVVGIEVRNLHWPAPTRPGDTIRATCEVLEARPSRSKPGFGTAHIRCEAVNQDGATVLSLTYVGWVARRPA